MKPLRLSAHFVIILSLVALSACSSKNDDSGAGKMYGKWKLHDIRYDQANRTRAQENAKDVLTQLQGEDKVCLIGLWAYNPPAILNAVTGKQLEGKVSIVGFDEDELTLKGIKDGHIHATVVQQPFVFGYGSVQVMAALAGVPNVKMPEEVKDNLWHVPHRRIDKSNVETFHQELNNQIAQGKAADPTPAAGAVKVAFVSNNEEEFWTIAAAGCRKAARDFGVEVLFRRPKPANAAEQQKLINDLINSDVKAIAVSVIDPENQKSFLDEIAKKVILVTVDNDAPATQRRCYIGTDNIAAGREVGKLVKEVLPDGGTISIFVGMPEPINAKERTQGVLDELAGK